MRLLVHNYSRILTVAASHNSHRSGTCAGVGDLLTKWPTWCGKNYPHVDGFVVRVRYETECSTIARATCYRLARSIVVRLGRATEIALRRLVVDVWRRLLASVGRDLTRVLLYHTYRPTDASKRRHCGPSGGNSIKGTAQATSARNVCGPSIGKED